MWYNNEGEILRLKFMENEIKNLKVNKKGHIDWKNVMLLSIISALFTTLILFILYVLDPYFYFLFIFIIPISWVLTSIIVGLISIKIINERKLLNILLIVFLNLFFTLLIIIPDIYLAYFVRNFFSIF